MRSTGADILVVDDEADIRELVSGLLEDEGHGVRVASNSDEALAAIRARRPSLALLALRPDCVVYNPMWQSVDELARILESGANVIVAGSAVFRGRGSVAENVRAFRRAWSQSA